MGDLSKFKWLSFPRVVIKSYAKESEGNIFVEGVVVCNELIRFFGLLGIFLTFK